MLKRINTNTLVILIIITSLFLTSCNDRKLKLIADLPSGLHEVSAVETVQNSDLIWIIEDSGNKNTLYGLNKKGKIINKHKIANTTNIDWEDLTSDETGHLYIGDFGNNSKKRTNYSIYKINIPKDKRSKIPAEKINFTLPESVKSKDFEAFFIYKNAFYIFSKEPNNGVLIKVPNKVGQHEAKLITAFNLDGENNLITSADISADGKTVVLLNHNKLWVLTNFTSDNFLKGSVEEIHFNQNSQKEGVCFKNKNTVYITDEKSETSNGNLYTFKWH